MAQSLQERITAALGTVIDTAAGTDVLSSGRVRDVATSVEGRVRVTVLLEPRDDATMVRDLRQALQRVSGVSDVKIDIRDPRELKPPPASTRGADAPAAEPVATNHETRTANSGGRSRALPVMDDRPAPQRPSVPAPTVYPALGHIIAVSSGKGGVGKSTVAVNLAAALAQRGARVGIMDADIYGPDIPRMLGVNTPPQVIDERIIPLEAHGMKIMSLGFLIERDQPAIWRGPIVMKIVTQFLRDVNWGQLDFLIVDMPPGTGDAQLSLVQATQVRGAVIVTTPQDVATGDALRGAKMFMRVGVPVLGVVENMSWFECPHCGKPTALFGSGGGQKLADELELPLLSQIPLYPRVMEGGDTGNPIVVAEPESAAAKALDKLAAHISESFRHA
jgi:ATP-binding protein involved in chromosome partitioning